MKGKWTVFSGVLLVVLLALAVGWVQAQGPQPPEAAGVQAALGNAFTYQGQLQSGGNPVNGNCDFQFSLWDSVTSGTQIGTTQTKTNVAMGNGLFTVQLDFGSSVFTGDARWLQIAVRCPAGSGPYTTLSPRQALTPAPYALALPGLWTQQNSTSPNLIGGYRGNSVTAGVVGAVIGGGGAAGIVNRVTDDYGTVGGGLNNRAGDDASTTNDQPYATVGGGYGNIASGGATVGGGQLNNAGGLFATVGGGVENSAVYTGTAVGGGWSNTASHDYAAVGGGAFNTASGPASTISGGWSNLASGESATVGGGDYNVAAAAYATIAGGGPVDPNNPTNTNNRVTDDYGSIGGGGSNRAGNGDSDTTNAPYTTVSGGVNNTASGYIATVGGGCHNSASDNYATIGGGTSNSASGAGATVGGGGINAASGLGATIGGGEDNTASGGFTTVGGGIHNMASEQSATIGGGWHNTASANAATVPGGADNIASGAYSFAAGAQAQATHPGAFVWSSAEATSSWGNDTFTVRSHGGARFYTAPGTGTGVVLASGSGSWSSLSDRAAKENFAPVDGRNVLDRLAAIPIQTWNYRSQDAAIRHIGPTAQDFYAAFGVGEDDTHISTVDADGVALAAIQGLYELSQEQDARIAQLEGRVAALEAQNAAQQAQIDDLQARLTALEQRAGGPSAPSGALPVYGLALAGLGLLAVVVCWRQREGGRR